MIPYYKERFTTAVTFLIVFYFVREEWILWLGASYLLLCFAIPLFDKFNYRIWSIISPAIQKIMNPVLMAIIFFVVLTPIAIFFRAFSKKIKGPDSNFSDIDPKENNFKEAW
jgi:hypothetical protein